MTASQLIEELDGRTTDDPEVLAEVQRIIDTRGVEAAKFYWLHGF